MEASCSLLMLRLTTCHFFVVCTTESTAELAGRVCEFRSRWNDAVHSYISRTNKKFSPLLTFLSLQVVRKRLQWGGIAGNFSLDQNSTKNGHNGHNVGVLLACIFHSIHVAP